jgi:hypothetical protein
MNIWDCLEQLKRENNPRLMVIVEADDAHYLLAVRDALKALANARVTKGKIAHAQQLLAQPWKEDSHDRIPHHQAGAVARPQLRRTRCA